MYFKVIKQVYYVFIALSTKVILPLMTICNINTSKNQGRIIIRDRKTLQKTQSNVNVALPGNSHCVFQ